MSIYEQDDSWFGDALLQALMRRPRGFPAPIVGSESLQRPAGVSQPDFRDTPIRPQPGLTPPAPFDEEPAPEQPGPPADESVAPPANIPPELPGISPVPPPAEVPQGPLGGPGIVERPMIHEQPVFGAIEQALANAGAFTPLRGGPMASRRPRSRRGFTRQRTIRTDY